MKNRCVLLALAVWLAAGAGGWASDQVKKTQGTALGTLTEMSALEVTIEQASVKTKIPVNQIEYIRYDSEPTLLNTARANILAGRYEDATAALEKIDSGSVKRKEIKQDIEFYKALAASRIALTGSGNVVEAGKMMADFVNTGSDNYHYLQACELVGDLLVANGKYATAQEYYARVGKAPWPDFQMKAGVALGRAQLADGKAAEALKSFQTVLDTDAEGELADRQRLAATLGKARCLAVEKKSDEAVKMVEDVIAKADPEQAALLAEAYNALGTAHREAGRTKDALLAFLHVDVLYFSSPTAHVEALQNLVELWDQVQKPQRAAAASRVLRERYKKSPR